MIFTTAGDQFLAKVRTWQFTTPKMMQDIKTESIRRTIAKAQLPIAQGGNMPVDTGFLRASGVAFVGDGNFSVTMKPAGAAPNSFVYDESKILVIIQSAKLPETVTFGWEANYAVYQNYGTSKMAGRKFKDLAAQQWKSIVLQVAGQSEHVALA